LSRVKHALLGEFLTKQAGSDRMILRQSTHLSNLEGYTMGTNYDELRQLWHEFLIFGPPIDQAAFHPMDFVAWLDTEEDNPYGLAEVTQFFIEKERHEGTAPSPQEQE
jgi:hypothetical protein